MKKETKTILGITYITGYEYDKVGSITAVIYPSGRRIEYAYNQINLPTGVTARMNATMTLANNLTYDPASNLTSMTFGSGLIQNWPYDVNNRIKTIQVPNILDIAYTFDPVGNITAIADQLDATKSKTYTYDALDRLSSANGPWGSLTWTYDADGNRLTQGNGMNY